MHNPQLPADLNNRFRSLLGRWDSIIGKRQLFIKCGIGHLFDGLAWLKVYVIYSTILQIFFNSVWYEAWISICDLHTNCKRTYSLLWQVKSSITSITWVRQGSYTFLLENEKTVTNLIPWSLPGTICYKNIIFNNIYFMVFIICLCLDIATFSLSVFIIFLCLDSQSCYTLTS